MTKARTLADNYAADINQVTATAPLTGGGTSGTVTVGIQAGTTSQSGAVQLTDSTASTSTTNAATPNSVKSAYDLANAAVAKSTIDAKGDLLVGTANDTVGRLAVASTAGYLLTVDSTQTTGLKWAAPAAGGKVLQVVYGSTTTETTNNTTTYADTTLTASITPSSASSKVLVLVHQGGCTKDAGSASAGFDGQLVRGATGIGYWGYDTMKTATALSIKSLSFGINVLDEPATTSSTTYKTTFRNMVGGSTLTVQTDGLISTIVLLEIGA